MNVCMIMWKKTWLFLWLSLSCMYVNSVSSEVISYDQRPSSVGTVGRLVKKEEWTPVTSTEFGAISAVDIGDRSTYHLQFITLEPNSLFLPVLLHVDMVFYVHTGSGRLSWAESNEKEVRKVELQRGDVYRLKSGTLFYLHSSLEPERPRLRIIAIFVNAHELELQEPSVGPYSSINDLIRGFNKKVLQAAFQVPEEVIEELKSATDTPAIVHAETQQKKKNFWEKDALYIDALLLMKRFNREAAENKKKHSKSKPFNFFKADPDFRNCNGWSTLVTKHDLDALHGSHIGVFMVNLTKGSMMGPHWNPKATEVSVVLEGEGMVRVVCPSTLAPKDCKNARFRVEEGDVFTVPRFHPMAQISFNNGSLVFMGFSTTTKENHPQFLSGKASVLQTLDRFVLGASFNVSNTTIDHLLAAQKESIILDCTSCAEEEEVLMEKEIEEDRREEEERRREEEEERRRKEEEERKRREEEDERRRKEEEERRRREEEEEQRRKEEEEERRRREEEEEQRRKEEERRHKEEEERRRQEEEEQRRREEEEQKQREEERRRQEEHEHQRQEEEEERERRRRQEEEAEEEKRQEEAKEKHQQEEEQRRHEEERRKKEEQRRQEEEEKRHQEEERKREEEEKQRQEEERQREEKEQRREEEQEEEAQRRHEAEEEWKQEEEKRRRHKEAEEEQRRREEEEQKEEEEEWRRQEERKRQAEKERRRREERGQGEEETEEAAARREEEERVERERQEEEAARRRREHEQPEWKLVKMTWDKDLNI